MLTNEPQPLSRTDCPDDPERFIESEGARRSLSAERSETPPLDAELPADFFYLSRVRSQVSSEVPRVDAGGRFPVIHNAFFVPGKVPSLNDLLDAKSRRQPVLRSIIMRQKPSKGNRYSLYNDIKQDWKKRTVAALSSPFVRVRRAYFGYLIIEETLKRDPSNICSAAVKFIEDGLVEAGVIPNDGWDNVLGIRVHWIHRKGQDPGVYVVMSDALMSEESLVTEYQEHLLSL